ncbi:MAG TPA: hypothetical protein VEA58_06195 [Anaerovoracaceae bacterium]|nr:hypothetical protein [Anaerovoracaceae bacterium]
MVSLESFSFNILPDALPFCRGFSCGIKATFRSGTPAQAALALLSVLPIQLKLWQKGESQ